MVVVVVVVEQCGEAEGAWVGEGSVSREIDFEPSLFWDREPVGGLRGQG